MQAKQASSWFPSLGDALVGLDKQLRNVMAHPALTAQDRAALVQLGLVVVDIEARHNLKRKVRHSGVQIGLPGTARREAGIRPWEGRGCFED